MVEIEDLDYSTEDEAAIEEKKGKHAMWGRRILESCFYFDEDEKRRRLILDQQLERDSINKNMKGKYLRSHDGERWVPIREFVTRSKGVFADPDSCSDSDKDRTINRPMSPATKARNLCPFDYSALRPRTPPPMKKFAGVLWDAISEVEGQMVEYDTREQLEKQKEKELDVAYDAMSVPFFFRREQTPPRSYEEKMRRKRERQRELFAEKVRLSKRINLGR